MKSRIVRHLSLPIFLGALLFLSACSSAPVRRSAEREKYVPAPKVLNEDILKTDAHLDSEIVNTARNEASELQEIEDLKRRQSRSEKSSTREVRDFLAKKGLEDMLIKHSVPTNKRVVPAASRRGGVIPVGVNNEVREWIRYFTVQERERFERFLKRGLYYRDHVLRILREEGVPQELYFLAMIESGYVTEARSHASAVGLWQFMAPTGKRYGLESNAYVDERRDPMRSTRAAVRYLKDLHNVFHSWYLAMAAYNSGEKRVLNAILSKKSRNFWVLSKEKALPPETRDYIPKFLAAVIVGSYPAKYGFTEIPSMYEAVPSEFKVLPKLMSASVPGRVRLTDIAKVTGISVYDLKEYNPHLIKNITPPHVSQYSVWMPPEHVPSINRVSALLRKHRVQGFSVVSYSQASADRGDEEGLSGNYHHVKEGETLAMIAKRYRVSMAQLKRMNRLTSNKIVAGERLKISGTVRSEKNESS